MIKLEKLENSTMLVTEGGDNVYINPFITDSYSYFRAKGYDVSYFYDRGLYLIKDKINQYYEEVNDFKDIKFNQETERFEKSNFLYKLKNYEIYILIDDTNGEMLINRIYHNSSDFDDRSEEIIALLNKSIHYKKDNSSEIKIVLRTNSGFMLKSYPINPLSINISEMYNDDFVTVHDKITDKLKNHNKGILLLHGKAGTGKTNYIKYLTTLIPEKKFVFIPVGMIEALSDPVFIATLIDNRGAILVLEDCENYLEDRNLSGQNNVVSTILNLTDGLLSDVLGIQIIATFNSNLVNIDGALMRSGRLIAEYEFDKLNLNKTTNLLKKLNHDFDDMTIEEMVLSDIFNIKDIPIKKETKQKKIGF